MELTKTFSKHIIISEKMEFSVKSIAFSIVIVTVVTWACKILNWVWLKPKKLEKQLRRQGFRGNSYRFLFGDVKEHEILSRQANSKPISLDDDIAPRVVPLYDQQEKLHGKYFNSFQLLLSKKKKFLSTVQFHKSGVHEFCLGTPFFKK